MIHQQRIRCTNRRRFYLLVLAVLASLRNASLFATDYAAYAGIGTPNVTLMNNDALRGREPSFQSSSHITDADISTLDISCCKKQDLGEGSTLRRNNTVNDAGIASLKVNLTGNHLIRGRESSLQNNDGTTQSDYKAEARVNVHLVYFKPQGSCPKKACAVTPLSLFGPEIAVQSHVAMTVHELPLVSNVLIITRGSKTVPEIAHHIKKLRHHNVTNGPMLIGLLEMADERNTSGNARYYGLFDYVIRNYYFHSLLGAPPSMYVRALGNWTCGTTKAEYENWPRVGRSDEGRQILYQEDYEPWLGVHWITNEEGPPQEIFQVIPSSKRSLDCNFVGSLRSHRRGMVKVFNSSRCVIQVEDKFMGSVPHDQYLEEFVAQTKITLAPWGNSHETIRAAEALNYGSIPLLIINEDNPHEYIHKFFRPIPAFYAEGWEEARKLVENVLTNWDAERLDEFQVEAMKWKHDYQECKWGDMYRLMRYGLGRNVGGKQVLHEYNVSVQE